MAEMQPIQKTDTNTPKAKTQTQKDPMDVLLQEIEDIIGVPLPKGRKALGLKK